MEERSEVIISSESDIIVISSDDEVESSPVKKKPRKSVDIDNNALQAILGPCTPIYENPQKGYSAIEMLNLIMGKGSSSSLCTRKPCGVRTFASFIVDLNSVRLKDLHADDNGSWVTSSPRRKYAIEMDDNAEKVISATSPENDSGEMIVTLYRQYGTHKGVPAFRRIIATACDAQEEMFPKAVVQYYFVGGKVLPIRVPSHGNSSRSLKPYFRTQPSTLANIKRECKSEAPSLVYHHALEDAGGAVASLSVSEEPRNKTQIYNARKNSTASAHQSKDELFDLLEMLQNHQSSEDGGFLREVVVGSTPSAILASKLQLQNLYSFCCQPENFSILGIDATFQLGDFYVTLMTYHNLILYNPRTGKPPVFVGPAFLHMQRRFEDYHTFLSCLLKLEPRLSSLKAYGTDGEGALVNALQACFRESIGLRCFVHKKRNLEERLKGASSRDRKEILADIFGIQDGDIFSTGLVDSKDANTFDQNFLLLRHRWDELVPGFYQWFSKEQASVFKKYLIADVREKALLGSPPERYTTNSNESLNAVVKKWVGFTKSSWPAFVEKLNALVTSQFNDVYKAVYRSGDFTLSPSLSSFHVDQVKWHHMTAKQRVAHVSKIAAAVEKKGQVIVQLDDSSLPGSSSRLTSQQKISIQSSDVTLPNVAQATIEGIWNKAERLLSEPGLLLYSPGNSNAFIVASETTKKPHFVQLYSNGKVACDEQCPMWRGRHVCAHAVAAAEKAGSLVKYLNWLQKSGQDCNITQLVTTTKERKSAGSKSGNPGRKRARMTTPISSYRNRIEDVCSTTDTGTTSAVVNPASVSVHSGTNINVCADGNSSSVQWTPPPYFSPSFSYSGWYGYPPSYGSPPPPFPRSQLPWQHPSPSSSVEQLPYVVKLLNNRIKKCRGCGSLFSRKADGSLLDPPNDLVVAHEERRPFADANNVARLSRLQNVYYHPNLACIRRHNASFMGYEIQVSAEVTLHDTHKKYLVEHFGWNQDT